MAMHKHPDPDEPRWITTKYDGKCTECHADVREGNKVLWDPRTRRIYCEQCGKEYF